MSLKYLIIGRTATGKDTFRQNLEALGMQFVKSYTDRAPRFDGEDTHIFLSPTEYDALVDPVATTTIANHRYCATRGQVEAANGYIIDPDGAYEVMQNMSDTAFVIVYIGASEEIAKCRFENRGGNVSYKDRKASEDARFSDLENKIKDCCRDLPANCAGCIVIDNNYLPETLIREAKNIANIETLYESIRHIADIFPELADAKNIDLLCAQTALDDELLVEFTKAALPLCAKALAPINTL